MRPALVLVLVVVACCIADATSDAATVPSPVTNGVHGRVVGWAKTGSDWFVVYVNGEGGDWCGLTGASWRIALVETARQRIVADQRLGGAMCGNSLSWVRAGKFSDGHHREAALMLWSTPSIGAWTYIYRLDDGRIRLLAKFAGDKVTLAPATVTVEFENRGRSPHGDLRDVFRFSAGRYHLASRH